MVKALMPRDDQGKFALKNSEHRSVRSLRLTTTTWTSLGEIAESLSLTRADLLEQMFRSNERSSPSNTRGDKERQPSNTREGSKAEPSNTRGNQEIEWLEAEVAQLREENAKLVERLSVQSTQVKDLEAVRDRVLLSLKLGKQAPGYKKALSALNQFIELLHSKL